MNWAILALCGHCRAEDVRDLKIGLEDVEVLSDEVHGHDHVRETTLRRRWCGRNFAEEEAIPSASGSLASISTKASRTLTMVDVEPKFEERLGEGCRLCAAKDLIE